MSGLSTPVTMPPTSRLRSPSVLVVEPSRLMGPTSRSRCPATTYSELAIHCRPNLLLGITTEVQDGVGSTGTDCKSSASVR
jgi:hypothetical protein